MKVVYTDHHRAHDVSDEVFLGLPIPAHEVVQRAGIIKGALMSDGGFELVEPIEHGELPILAVHDRGLLRFLAEAWSEVRRQAIGRQSLVPDAVPNPAMFEGMSEAARRVLRPPAAIGGRAGWYGFDTSNPIVPGTYEAARWAVDVALTAVDLVLDGEPLSYGLCRPPGHHAARAMAAGYCFFNNAAIAADAIVRATGERVAILDVDYHHGNGTQQIFWRRGDVLYASLHGDPARVYPYYLGYADEVGEGDGVGMNLNLPLPAHTDDAAYLAALDRALDAIDATPGGIVVVSLGFDTYRDDPLGDFDLTRVAYVEAGRRTAALGRRLVILQEGGYHLPSLGKNAGAWLKSAEAGAAAHPGTIVRS
ncbi:MAG TPA: histone deacetylase family protein [Candidatus Limnocylindrales bacterium]|nr:histone deacetylase family protein [Candidatus Limnocylindrales bacterium]